MNISDSLIVIDDSLSDKINSNEQVNFNRLFFSFIFRILLKRNYSVLGTNKAGTKRTSKTKLFRNFYLIENKLFPVFDFVTFVEDITNKLDERIPETYSLYFDGYLFQYLKRNGKNYFDEIKFICERIILNEFDLVVNSDGYLLFERNTSKPLQEYIVEILTEYDKVMKVEEISNCLNTKFPFLETSEQSVRATLIREKEIFIYFGRSSTYGLKKWEREKENVKGGTIRDIVEEYLWLEKSPKHISEILEYVLKFRHTNEKSVMSNIVVEENNRFQFFDGDFVGLSNITYNLENIKFKRLIGTHFRKSIFQKLNGWKIEDVINYFVHKFNYQPVQIKFIIQKKTESGELKITSENTLSV